MLQKLGVFVISLQVFVEDPSSYVPGGGICGGYNDPHMVTFDRRYWENQRVGEFVMYQHKTKPFAVRFLRTLAWWYGEGRMIRISRTIIHDDKLHISL
mgnify:CR=1 FL=1